MHYLIDSLRKFHAEKAKLISRIDDNLPAIEKGDIQARSELRAQIESFRGIADKAHHYNEELILSELKKTSAPIHRRINAITEDHLAFGGILQRLCAKIDDSLVEPTVLVSDTKWFLGQYDEHATNEEAILFPAAEQHLSQSAWARVEKAWDSTI